MLIKTANKVLALVIVITTISSLMVACMSSSSNNPTPTLPYGNLVTPTTEVQYPTYTPPMALSTLSNHNTANTPSAISTASILEITPIPLEYGIEPLPHDGLFIRRNNQYGTIYSTGIKELIDQGVLIDRNRIRFDEFIAMNTADVPLPDFNSSLAISYGISTIPSSQNLKNGATHYLEIALRASDQFPQVSSKREPRPVNYVFVVDISGSMRGDKLESVKTSITGLLKKMRNEDMVGIIVFNENPIRLFRATAKNNIDMNQFNGLISNLYADGGTDINIGLSYGIDEITRNISNDYLHHIFLFTDGNPTSGVIDWNKIRQNVSEEVRDLNIHISTFAFGSDANVRELSSLAGVANGKSTVVLDPTNIEVNLENELSRRDQLAAVNIQISLEIDQDVQILHFYGHDLVQDPIKREAVFQDVSNVKATAESDS